jgi:hypothetical protein
LLDELRQGESVDLTLGGFQEGLEVLVAASEGHSDERDSGWNGGTDALRYG